MSTEVFHCPVFEGSEKRISVHFSAAAAAAAAMLGGGQGLPGPCLAPPNGLRALSRGQLDGMLDLAACQIVSTRSNEHFDAYVLSESSLFVYPDRMVLKTCGTTRLLDCIPHMVGLANSIGLAPARVHYSRASFLFPDAQPAPHRSFTAECNILRGIFGGLGSDSAYVLGDALNGLQWHVFVAGAENAHATRERPLHTLEICMTGLAPAKSAQFFRGDDFVSSRTVTVDSGIQDLIPGAEIDDYVFEPCGYSMNGIEDEVHSTIHITPEDGFSYASFELCGHDPCSVDVAAVIARTATIFQPRNLSVALSLDSVAPGASAPGWGGSFIGPAGYDCHSASYQEIKCGGYVAYFTLERQGSLRSTPPSSPTAAGVEAAAARAADALATTAKSPGSDGSPRGVLKHFPSCANLVAAGAAAARAARAAAAERAAAGSAGAVGSPTGAAGAGCAAADDLTASLMSVATNLDLMALAGSIRGTDSHDSASDNASVGCGSLLMADSCATPPLPSELRLEDVMSLHGAEALPSGDAANIEAHMRRLIAGHGLEDNFYVIDLGALARLHAGWSQLLPRVTPFYAVKCNPDQGVLATLAALGACFDCASETELASVLGLGVSPDRIVFANPCKRPRDLRYAASKGVTLSTFDTEAELDKLARMQPGAARVLLRIRADDPTARCQLGNKYGAEPGEWEMLFASARACGVDVVGVAFHVGSGATDPAAFAYAIQLARAAWDLGLSHGFDMQVLDIGGGFAGGRFSPEGTLDMGPIPAAINIALDAHFPAETGVRVIAEPGRYFTERIATLGCMVLGRRPRHAGFDYWVTDGLYGSMNSVLYDHATLETRPLVQAGDAPPETGNAAPPAPCYPSTVFGPSCDGLDTLLTDVPLPELQVGDWLAFHSMGAYALCGASKFNGINAVDVPAFYVASGSPF